MRKLTIVVGVDKSSASLDAVALAAREAAWRRRPLRIVHAFGWALMPVPTGPAADGPADGGLRHDAEHLLAEAAKVAGEAEPGIEVTTALIDGVPAPVLLQQARSADLVVLGSRGLGGFTGLLVGSVAMHLAAHSPAPVLVARGTLNGSGPVLLGADCSPESAGAVDCAYTEAQLRHAELVAVRTWTGPESFEPTDMMSLVFDPKILQEDAHRLLAQALAGHGDSGVRVRREVIRDRPARALVRLSEQAQLVVVGTRGRGGFAGLLLGSTSHQLLHHAHCPVLVVPRKA